MTSAEYKHITILLPGLFWPMQKDDNHYALGGLSVSWLELLMSRARRRQQNKSCLEETLFDLFGIKVNKGADLPVAPLSCLYDIALPDKYCLRADPVYLRPDRDRLIMIGNRDLDITVHEVDEINEYIKSIFIEKGWSFYTPVPDRWYLQLPDQPRIHTHCLQSVIGKDIRSLMPYGEDERQWRSLLNEIQMMLHDCPVNSSRKARGVLPVNSLWFWGGGYLPEAGLRQWAQVWADDVLALGLADLTNTPHAALPEDGYEWLKGLSKPGKHLVILDQAGEHEQFCHLEGWQQALNSLSKDWFAPVLSALKSRVIDSITLDTLGGDVYDINSWQARRWWLRTRKLDSFSKHSGLV